MTARDDIPTAECPAGICGYTAATFDHDAMFGHLLTKHKWTYDTIVEWMREHMADDDEARRLEDKHVRPDGRVARNTWTCAVAGCTETGDRDRGELWSSHYVNDHRED